MRGSDGKIAFTNKYPWRWEGGDVFNFARTESNYHIGDIVYCVYLFNTTNATFQLKMHLCGGPAGELTALPYTP